MAVGAVGGQLVSDWSPQQILKRCLNTASVAQSFFRGLVDAAAALEHATGEPALEQLGWLHLYNDVVFPHAALARNQCQRSRAATWGPG